MFFAIVVPVVINYAFTQPAWLPLFAFDWEAKDALAFYGSILGAGATIFVLRQTIVFTRENQREERKLSVKPYLQTNISRVDGPSNSLVDDSITFLEIKNGIIESSKTFPEDLNNLFVLQDKVVRQKLIAYNTAFAQQSTNYFMSHLLLVYEIKNCGAGNAINVKFEINGFKGYPAFCITTTEPKRFVLILNEDIIDKSAKNVKLSVTYSDICSFGLYTQTESISFFRDKEGVLSFSQLSENLLTAPEEITEKK